MARLQGCTVSTELDFFWRNLEWRHSLPTLISWLRRKLCQELNERIQEASAEIYKCQTCSVNSSHRLESESLNITSQISPYLSHFAPLLIPLLHLGAQSFRVNLPQPPRFGTISVDSDLGAWLYTVSNNCHLSLWLHCICIWYVRYTLHGLGIANQSLCDWQACRSWFLFMK